ncbi:MAG: tetratricopeptide repeat protein [Bacteroidetes bacterium]|nr:tetratricopeptide repeat protein [Bacteroidota bacterium]
MMSFVRPLLFCLMIPVLLAAQTDSTGIRLLNAKKYAEARAYFEQAVQRNGKDAESHYFLAMTLMIEQQLDEAEESVDEAIDINDGVSKYHLLRGQILGQQAMTANVLSQGLLAPKIKNAFQRASELDPSNVDARLALYNYYVMAPGFMGGSTDKAFDQANAIVKLEPLRGYLLLANYYNRVKKDTAEAERQIKKAIAAAPEKGNGYKQLGYLYMNTRRYAEAYEQMKKYAAADPKNPDAHDSYGDVLKAEGKYDQAVAKYHLALSMDKGFSPSIFSLAECYELQGNKQKAKETYQWFLTVEPKGRRAETAQKKIKEL